MLTEIPLLLFIINLLSEMTYASVQKNPIHLERQV